MVRPFLIFHHQLKTNRTQVIARVYFRYSVNREEPLATLVPFCYALICLFQSDDRGSLTLSLCQQPTAGHLHVIIMKATGLPPPKSDAPGGLGK